MSFRRKLLLNLYKLSDVCILTVSLIFASWFVAKKDWHVASLLAMTQNSILQKSRLTQELW